MITTKLVDNSVADGDTVQRADAGMNQATQDAGRIISVVKASNNAIGAFLSYMNAARAKYHSIARSFKSP